MKIRSYLMRMNGNVRLIGILVLAMFVLTSVQVMSAAPDQQTWHFTNTEASAPIYSGADYNKIMKKGVEGGNDKITLAPGERVWFYADELAQCNVDFPEGKWSVVYWVKALDSNASGKKVYTRLCNVTSTDGYTRLTGGSENIVNPGNIEKIVEDKFNDNVNSFTVKEGGRFAIEVYWENSDQGNLEIHCNPPDKHASNVASPSSDPGYPVPELSTFILFSTGLIALVEYVLLRRK
jgi:hypothetical protein